MAVGVPLRQRVQVIEGASQLKYYEGTGLYKNLSIEITEIQHGPLFLSGMLRDYKP
jgi:hypothetical protein